jgi:D-lactate dehydrogenase (cytochrome)
VLDNADVVKLQQIVGEENVSVRGADLEAHSIDESCFEPHLPDVIVWPNTVEEISQIMRHANERGIPVVPWSGGSSLEGNPIPTHGGIILAMYRWNKIVEIREDDLQVVVQPGIVYDNLNEQLKRLALFFPPAPGSSDVATIGGMVNNNSSGMRAIKYGVTRDYVMKLQVVLPDGQILNVGSNAKKTTSGYDLVSLFVGSEGTLGVITEVTLRLISLPEKIAAVLAVFDTLSDAAHTVYECIRYGLDPSAVEILDSHTVRATNLQQGLSLQETPTLFVEFHGNEASLEDQIDYLQELCEENNCIDFQSAMTADTRETLWKARKEARESIKQSHPGWAMISGDVCVPISKFSDMVDFVHDLSERTGILIYAFGHAGDGNLHTEALVPRDDKELFERGMRTTDDIVGHALALGGTIAGEHGIGLGKAQYMRAEHGPTLELMRSIKQLLDPKGIMNPGKIFPAE